MIGGEAPARRCRATSRASRATLRPDAVAAAPLVGRSVLAFAGIARPEKFFATLEGLGARVAVRRGFADHHRFRERRDRGDVQEAERRGLTLVTTEKDFTRIPQQLRAPIAALPVSLAFEDAKGFGALLATALGKARAR